MNLLRMDSKKLANMLAISCGEYIELLWNRSALLIETVLFGFKYGLMYFHNLGEEVELLFTKVIKWDALAFLKDDLKKFLLFLKADLASELERAFKPNLNDLFLALSSLTDGLLNHGVLFSAFTLNV